MRALLPILSVLLAAPTLAQNPTQAAPPTFEVASIHQNKGEGPQHSTVPLDSGNIYSTLNPDDSRSAASGLLIATRQPLWRYITFAYHLSGTQELAVRFNFFSGLPKSTAPTWVTGTFNSSADLFDITARAPAGTTLDQMRLMMQSLLADRFHLAAHHQTTDAPVFALLAVSADTPAPNLQAHPASDTCATPEPGLKPANPAEPLPSTIPALPPICGVIAHVASAADPRTSYGGRAIPLALLATSLPTMTGMAIIPRPVVDQTGLTGLYDFTLHWTTSSDPESGDTAASFHQALKDQLHLALKSTRAPIDIDHIDHPSGN